MTWLFIIIPVEDDRNLEPKYKLTVEVTATASPARVIDNQEDDDDVTLG